MTFRPLRRSGIPLNAALAIALLVLGAVGHFAHHLLDPDCIDGRGPSEHQCACSVLHGAALTEGDVTVTPSAPSQHVEPIVPEAIALVAEIPGRVAPRAPPLA